MRSPWRGCRGRRAGSGGRRRWRASGWRPLAGRAARRLSGGEQQRLAMARAWALRPEVLFMDEPCASLDPAAARVIEGMIRAFGAEGMTVVMTTHDLAQARRLAEDVVFLHRGRLIESGAGGGVLRGAAVGGGAGVSGGGALVVKEERKMTRIRGMLAGLLLALAALPAAAADAFITVASTTSTENSGLFGDILPKFQEKTGIEVRVVAQGTGQALETAKRGDADVVFVHARPAEEKFVAEGWGVERFDVMYNDFVIAGPSPDPAAIRGAANAVEAMAKIAAAEAPFASRGTIRGRTRRRRRSGRRRGSRPGATGTARPGAGWGRR